MKHVNKFIEYKIDESLSDEYALKSYLYTKNKDAIEKLFDIVADIVESNRNIQFLFETRTGLKIEYSDFLEKSSRFCNKNWDNSFNIMWPNYGKIFGDFHIKIFTKDYNELSLMVEEMKSVIGRLSDEDWVLISLTTVRTSSYTNGWEMSYRFYIEEVN